MANTAATTIYIVTEQQATLWEAYDADRNEPGEVTMIGAHTTLEGARRQANYALKRYQETEGHDHDRVYIEEKPHRACWRARITSKIVEDDEDEDESTVCTVEIVVEPLRKLDAAPWVWVNRARQSLARCPCSRTTKSSITNETGLILRSI